MEQRVPCVDLGGSSVIGTRSDGSQPPFIAVGTPALAPPRAEPRAVAFTFAALGRPPTGARVSHAPAARAASAVLAIPYSLRSYLGGSHRFGAVVRTAQRAPGKGDKTRNLNTVVTRLMALGECGWSCDGVCDGTRGWWRGVRAAHVVVSLPAAAAGVIHVAHRLVLLALSLTACPPPTPPFLAQVPSLTPQGGR